MLPIVVIELPGEGMLLCKAEMEFLLFLCWGVGDERLIENLELTDVVSWTASSRTCLVSPSPVPGLKSHAIVQTFFLYGLWVSNSAPCLARPVLYRLSHLPSPFIIFEGWL